jgi:hypothetical protein
VDANVSAACRRGSASATPWHSHAIQRRQLLSPGAASPVHTPCHPPKHARMRAHRHTAAALLDRPFKTLFKAESESPSLLSKPLNTPCPTPPMARQKPPPYSSNSLREKDTVSDMASALPSIRFTARTTHPCRQQWTCSCTRSRCSGDAASAAAIFSLRPHFSPIFRPNQCVVAPSDSRRSLIKKR